MLICKNTQCKKEHDGSYGSGIFCSRSCANSRKSPKNKTKESTCPDCKKTIQINVHGVLNKTRCEECKIINSDKYRIRKCKVCGTVAINKSTCPRPDICKRYSLLPYLVDYFGLNQDTIGTTAVYKEYEDAVKRLEDDYWILGLSTIKIAEKRIFNANEKDITNVFRILKSLNIETRTLSQAGTNAILKYGITESPNGYKNGYHTTWENKKVYYRSSYELEFMYELDTLQISYEVEFLRIQYWDADLLKYKIAVPDFYLPDYNMIVEIKSDWTLDKSVLIKKVKEYLKLGYEFTLVLEKELFFTYTQLLEYIAIK